MDTATTIKSARPRQARPETASSEPIVHGIPRADAVSTQEAKSRLEPLFDKAQATPVAITKQNKPVAVLLSVQAYQHLQRLDDAYWTSRAEENEATGELLSAEESEAFTQELLNAQD